MSTGIKRRSIDDDEPVSTLHVSGLPADINERELRLLATFLPGLEGAVICRGTGKTGRSQGEPESQIGFIKFNSQAFAMAGAQALHGFLFDERNPESALRVSLARRNMNIRSSGVDRQPAYPYPYPSFDYSSMYGQAGMGMGAAMGGSMAGYGAAAAAAAAQQSFGGGGGGGAREGGGQEFQRREQSQSREPQAYTVQTRGKDAQCNTLCVRGLPYNLDDSDLEPFFNTINGYNAIKVFAQKALAFVAFDSKEDAEKAMAEIEGKVVTLPGSTGRDTVLVEFARRPLEIRDA